MNIHSFIQQIFSKSHSSGGSIQIFCPRGVSVLKGKINKRQWAFWLWSQQETDDASDWVTEKSLMKGGCTKMWADFRVTGKEWCSAPEWPLWESIRSLGLNGQNPGRAEGRGCGLCRGPRLGETHRERRHLRIQTPVSSLPTGPATGKPQAGSILGPEQELVKRESVGTEYIASS